MRLRRRSLLAGALGTAAIGRTAAPAGPSVQDLDRAAAAPVKRELWKAPVIIESIKLLKKDGEYFVHVRSKDGAEGVSLPNPPRADLIL